MREVAENTFDAEALRRGGNTRGEDGRDLRMALGRLRVVVDTTWSGSHRHPSRAAGRSTTTPTGKSDQSSAARTAASKCHESDGSNHEMANSNSTDAVSAFNSS